MSAINTQGEMLTERQDASSAKKWELILYPLTALGGNCFMLLMMIVSFYAAGIVGLGTVIASFIITGSRVLDGFLDPFMGYLVDKTNGKLGKVKLFLLLGFVVMSISTALIYYTAYLVPDEMRTVYFMGLYALYIIGYTLYVIAARSGYAILTKDPKQRPIFGAAEAIYMSFFAAGGAIYLSSYLAPKYGGFSDPGLFQEFTLVVIAVAGTCMAIGLFVIWPKDRIENYGDGNPVIIKFKDMWPILKGNRPLQMFIVAAATDKLSMQIQGNQVINVMLFGIIMGNFALLGTVTSIAIIPNILLIVFGMRYASKVGLKKGLVATTWLAIFATTLLVVVLWLGDPTQIAFNDWGFMTIAFLVLFLIAGAARSLATAYVVPMIPEIIDYEAYRSKRFTPGIVTSLYTFVDKLVSSLAQTVIGLVLAMIGFRAAFPDLDTPYSETLFWVTMFLAFGVLIIGWIATLIAMKFYKLDKAKMDEIAEVLEARRQENMDAG
ncbi:glucuronide permease [Salipaludibacillus neizhouensis]|uniref:Glucuronide permease n=1 Tax=Salipaludibacillus neizhouensis TaxID=885475 RepID=A0A3A9JZ95_9BACI|nr:MFS transporter [Salipaludibacillus neizhouensis]RKL65509.1 glucuronide permease [Salipaludibacillus neizhouensis]